VTAAALFAPRVALDTGVLASAEGLNGRRKQARTRDLIGKLPREATIIPVQALGELCHLLVHEAHRSPESARAALLSWQESFPVAGTSPDVLHEAALLITARSLSIWEALIVAAASQARCRLLLSENYGAEFTWSGVTVANPFLRRQHPILDRLLRP
jgi:predicted nucleic acid-binding protein